MSVDTTFCLNGVGYLHDVFQKDDGLHAKINVIHQFNSSAQHSDDVWIDCIVNDKNLLLLLDELKLNLEKQKQLSYTLISLIADLIIVILQSLMMIRTTSFFSKENCNVSFSASSMELISTISLLRNSR